ncbi:MAG TPA: hypothetical protein DCM45_04285 [Clostridiales bacterium]|nr:hypothetical protein [Clostridiales bacterium]
MRDVLSISADDPEMLFARESAMKSKPIARLIEKQHADGSFGRFTFITDPDTPNGGVNESAMIRALALGLEPDHALLVNLRHYFEAVLQRLAGYGPDDPERPSMPIARSLILAACLRQLGSDHPLVSAIARDWQQIIESSFDEMTFQTAVFRDKCEEIFGPDQNIWPEKWPEFGFSRYMLLLMKDQLPFKVEQAMIHHQIYQSRGIYPVSNRSLLHFPLEFASRESVRFITSLESLTQYTSAAVYLRHAADWLWEQLDRDGFWDLGTPGRDNRHLPLSESWRSRLARQKDCTVRILALVTRLQQTCELYDKSCHYL